MVEQGDLTELKDWLKTKGIQANDLVAWTKDEKELPKVQKLVILMKKARKQELIDAM